MAYKIDGTRDGDYVCDGVGERTFLGKGSWICRLGESQW